MRSLGSGQKKPLRAVDGRSVGTMAQVVRDILGDQGSATRDEIQGALFNHPHVIRKGYSLRDLIRNLILAGEIEEQGGKLFPSGRTRREVRAMRLKARVPPWTEG